MSDFDKQLGTAEGEALTTLKKKKGVKFYLKLSIGIVIIIYVCFSVVFTTIKFLNWLI